jgi:sodium transport system permease protein
LRVRIVWTIFRKELLETLRDRRTLLMMIGLPVLLYPMMIIAVSWFQQSQAEERENRSSIVAVWGDGAEGLLESIRSDAKVTIRRWARADDAMKARLRASSTRPPAGVSTGDTAGHPRVVTEADNPVLRAARAALAADGVDAVLVLWPDLRPALDNGSAGSVSVYFDSVRPDSMLARDRLLDALSSYRSRLVSERERERGLSSGFATAIEILSRNVASESRRSAELLGMLLPFVLIVMSLLGGLYPAIDLTAGEKERGTMQTLMCAPVRGEEIILGKFLTVWMIALITALANIVSLAATLSRIVPGTPLKLPLAAYAMTFGMLVPVTFIVSALFLAVAAFARDFKDGQNFLMPVYMVLAMPAVVTMLPGVQLTAVTAFVPVLNIALLIKSVLLSNAPADLAFLALLSSLTYAGLAVLLAARVFEMEQVLLGGRQPILTLLGLERRPGRTVTPSFAIVSFAVLLVAVFYGSLFLRHAGTAVSVLVTEYGFFLLPTLVIVAWFRFPWRTTLSLRRPPVRALFGSALIGVSGWTVAAGVLVRLLPPPDSLTRALERMLLLDNRAVPLWIVWLVLAVTPAVCEEIYFRGFVLSGLRRLGTGRALIVSALLFGLAHSSVYRLLPTAVLGLLFGYAVWRSGSIACGILAHALNNGISASIVSAPHYFGWLGMSRVRYLPWSVTIPGLAVLLVGVLLVRSVPRHQEQGSGTRDASTLPA